MEDRETLLQRLERLPEALLPELGPEARELRCYLVLDETGLPGNAQGYAMTWQEGLGELDAEFQVECRQTAVRRPETHQLYRGVLYENSNYNGQQNQGPIILSFDLGQQRYTLRGSFSADAGEAALPEARAALEARLRARLEQLIDRSLEG